MNKDNMKPVVYFAGDKEKAKATTLCGMIIDLIENSSKEVLFKAYVMQMLLESFEETFDVDIRHGISISETGEQDD